MKRWRTLDFWEYLPNRLIVLNFTWVDSTPMCSDTKKLLIERMFGGTCEGLWFAAARLAQEVLSSDDLDDLERREAKK